MSTPVADAGERFGASRRDGDGRGPRLAFVFPGQGSQRLGMGSWLRRWSAGTREVFDRVSEAAGLDLLDVCARGPAEVLTSTDYAQPAIFACNAAAELVLGDEGFTPALVAGHSLGEFNALCAAGVLSFDQAVDLVVYRSRLMASVTEQGAMASVMGLSEDVVEELCAEASFVGPVVVALYNAPGNVVVSGDAAAVARCSDAALQAGARRVVPLVTSNAFHSPLMATVLPAWRDVVEQVRFRPPRVPLLLNALGGLAADPDVVRRAVVDQLVQPVRWSACMRVMATDVDTFVEVGDATVLSSLVRLSGVRAPTFSLDSPRALTRLAASAAEAGR